jgi:hypothetical protein
MNPSRHQHIPAPPAETWNEEFSRAKKFREATQKRQTQKQAERKIETLKKRLAVGRLLIEQ